MRNKIFFALLALGSCTAEKNAPPVAAQPNLPAIDSAFNAYLDLLPIVTLPFETNCDRCCNHPDIDYDNQLISRFRPEGSAIVGLVGRTNDKAIILVTFAADMLVPSLKVYDLTGKLLGEQNFITNYCGGDSAYYGQQFLRINHNLTITQIDSLWHFALDSVDYHITDTTKIEVTKENYRIDDNGEIVEDITRP
jgi:hypothetical protein